MSFTDKLNIDFNKLNFFQKIIAVNVIVYILYKLMFIFKYQSKFISLFSIDSNILTKPWSIITYAFIHHVIFSYV